jgi:hypothetical protein
MQCGLGRGFRCDDRLVGDCLTEKLIGRSNQPLSKSFLVRTRTLSTARISVTRKLAMAAARLNIGGIVEPIRHHPRLFRPNVGVGWSLQSVVRELVRTRNPFVIDPFEAKLMEHFGQRVLRLFNIPVRGEQTSY